MQSHKLTFPGLVALTVGSLLAGLFATGWITRQQVAPNASKPNRTGAQVAFRGLARPNIVFIITDDHTWQAISSYGGRYTDPQH